MTDQQQDIGKLWALRAGPYHNPNEIYPYLSLPFCTYRSTNAVEDINAALSTSRMLRDATGGLDLSWGLLIDNLPTDRQERSVTYSCTTPPLTEDQAAMFTKAVTERWFYEWYYDGLPLWGMVGDIMPRKNFTSKIMDGETTGLLQPSVFTKRNLQIEYYNGTGAKTPAIDSSSDRVVLTSDLASLQAIQAGQAYTFELEVDVVLPPVTSNQGRYDRYLDHDFFNHPVHRMSLYNSEAIVLFLAVVLGGSLYTTCKYNRNPDNHKDGHEEATIEDGKAPLLSSSSTKKDQDNKTCCKLQDPSQKYIWKQLNSKDVLVAPTKPMALAALVGNGWHVVVVMILLVFGLFFTKTNSVQLGHGGFGRLFGQVYLATTVVAGFVSGYHHQQWTTANAESDSAGHTNSDPPSEDKSWRSVMAATALLLPTIATLIVLAINAASLPTGTSGGFEMPTILRFLGLWVAMGLPGNLAGTLVGRWWHRKRIRTTRGESGSNTNGDWISHQQWNSLSLSLPTSRRFVRFENPLRRYWWIMTVVGGIVPFSVVYIESYFVMTSLWNYKFFVITKTTVGVFVSWVLVTCVVAILHTIIYLNSLLHDQQQTNRKRKDWHWQAFRSVAAPGMCLFLYSIYYYCYKTQMAGLFQTTYFFGTMLFLSIVVSIAGGAVGHFAASQIIRLLYSTLPKAA